MSTVLEIDDLLESPLSDLHAIAGELDIEDYRLMRKAELTVAILAARGAVPDEIRETVTAKAEAVAKERQERERAALEAEEAEIAAREEARSKAASERARGAAAGGAARGRQSRRGEHGKGGQEKGGQSKDSGGRGGRSRGQSQKAADKREADGQKGRKDAPKDDKSERKESGGRRSDQPTTPLAGVFEPGSGGGGRLRTDITHRVRGDADVPRGEVRRWNLQRGDLINAQVKKARRGRTDFVVASIDNVNGLDQQAAKADRTDFAERPATGVGGRYAKKTFKHAPVGAGSRLVITGPTRAAASQMLRKLAGELVQAQVVTTLVVVSAAPEQSESINGVEVLTGDATKPADHILQALELALDRDRRLAEQGRETALLVDGLDLLETAKAVEILAAARNLADGGALTVAAAAGPGSVLESQATAIAVVAGGRKLKLDKKASWAG